MKRSALALILAVLMTVGLLTIGAAADDNVEYIDASGTKQSCEQATKVEASDTAWSTGWYVVSESVTIETRITVTGDVNLILADDCTLTATKGISVTSGNSLTIYGQSEGSGELIAKATQLNRYAGIGGEDGNSSGKVAAHGDITINGGIIKAESVGEAAGIGSGTGGSGTNGTITINGGTIEANGGGNGAGIGGGYFNNIAGGDIVINGGAVEAKGGVQAAGIGTGYSDQQANGRSIKITGGTVIANGGMNAAGIGGGYGCKAKSIRSITINGTANVTATGGDGADNGGAGAGIGSGYATSMATTIKINTGVVVIATGGNDETYGGAGIGSGGGTNSEIGDITIIGGTVTATGGEGTYGGAGIGSGGYSKIVASDPPYSSPATGTLTINAGIVNATGGNGAAGIGNGANGVGGDFTTDRENSAGEPVNGKAVIYASSITDNDDTTDWDGIIFQGNEGQVYGEITLQNDLTLENGRTLKVPENSKLTVPTNKKLVVKEGAELIIEENGTLYNNGEVTVQGALTSNGTISGSGTFTGAGAGDLDFAAEFNGTKYATLNAAINAANDAAGGGTVTLLKDATISNSTAAMDEDVTLSVGSGKTLTVSAVSYLTNGALAIQTGGELKLGADTLVGTAGMVDLTDGTAKLDFNNVDTSVSLTLDGKASVVGSLKALWVTSNDQSSFVPMAITVTSGSKATVANGGVLNLVKGSSLTLADGAIFTVDGILEVHSTAEFDDKAAVSGKVYVFEAASGTNPIDGASITLTSTGAVYAQLTQLEGTTITPARMTVSDETYTSTSATTETAFANEWTLSYKVTLDANGGTLAGTTNELWTDANGKLTTTPGAPSKLNYDFKGWDSNNDGAVDYAPGAAIENIKSDLTLTAVWALKQYTVSFDSAGGSAVPAQTVDHGSTIELPTVTKPGYIFMGWKCGNVTYQAGETIKVTGNMTFTAIWANMPDITPSEPDDEPDVPDFPFTDVKAGQWFYEAVKYVYGEGIMNGMDRYTFEPNGSLTRAMVWTMLARLDGVDTEGGATWYSKAQDWAMSLDVSDGTNPMGEITRQELVTMLWRYAYVCDADMTLGDDTNILSYIDIDKVSDWAVEAFQWCCGAGIIEGDENGALNPTAGCTRAEAAAMFMRLCKNVDLSPTV